MPLCRCPSHKVREERCHHGLCARLCCERVRAEKFFRVTSSDNVAEFVAGQVSGVTDSRRVAVGCRGGWETCR
jgi:hypothetical protein